MYWLHNRYTFPETTERLSHGKPTFFVRKWVAVVLYALNNGSNTHAAANAEGDEGCSLAGAFQFIEGGA
jgi:hypothetical protein